MISNITALGKEKNASTDCGFEETRVVNNVFNYDAQKESSLQIMEHKQDLEETVLDASQEKQSLLHDSE